MKETHEDTLYVDCGLHILMPLEWEQNVHVHVYTKHMYMNTMCIAH